MKLLSLIVPVLDEEEAIPLFYEAVQEVLRDEPYELEILFVDDGSTDRTLEIIEGLHARDPRVRGISFSRNFGKELALSAGLQAARGDAVVPMDVDLQDPPALLKQFLRLWEQGYETVIGVRSRRDADSWAKRVSAGLFYRLFNRLTKGRVVLNAGDYRLMDRMVVDALNALPERVRFTKGLYGWVGFRSAIVEYERPARVAGNSKWPGWKLWNFALDGITSFSTLPLRLWSYLGMIVALAGFSYAGYLIFKTLVWGVDVPGYAITDGGDVVPWRPDIVFSGDRGGIPWACVPGGQGTAPVCCPPSYRPGKCPRKAAGKNFLKIFQEIFPEVSQKCDGLKLPGMCRMKNFVTLMAERSGRILTLINDVLLT